MGQSIFLNVVIASIGRIFVVLLGLTATYLTVRIISVESFGAYSLVLTIGTFLQLFADFGLYLTASHELGAGKERDTVMHHVVSLRLLLLAVLFIGGLTCFFFIPSLKSMALLFVIISFGLIAQSLSQLMMGVFQVCGSIWKATFGDILGRISQVLVLGYLLVRNGQDSLIGVAVAFTASLCISLCIHAVLVPKRRSLLPRISIPIWRYLVQTSWPIALMLVLNVIYFRGDILILSLFESGEEVGWYGLAYKVVESGLFFPAMLGGLLLPHVSSALASGNKQRAAALVSQALALSIYSAIIVVTTLIVFSAPLIAFIAGPEFAPSAPLLQILALALAIMFMGNIFGFALIALSQQRRLATLYGLLVLFNIGANFLFIPQYGASAAAWVTVATECIAMLTASYFVYAKLGFRLHVSNIVFAVLGSCVAAYVGALLPESIHIAPRLVVVIALYLGIGYSLRIWDKGTLSLLRTASSI